MSNKPGTTTQNTQTTNAPLSGAQGGLFNDIWGGTDSWLKSALGKAIPQNVNAGATDAQWQGAQGMIDMAPWLGSGAKDTMDLSRRISSGFYTDPQNDPSFHGAVNAALDPIKNQLTGSILPSIGDASVRASGGGTGPAAYGSSSGGSPQDIMTQKALQSWDNTAANTTASMAENSRNAGMSLFGLVPGLSTSAISQGLAPSLAQEQGGSLMQGFNQIPLTNMLQNYLMSTQFPQQFLSGAAGIGAQGGFGQKDQTQQTTGPAPNMMTQWLQGLLGGGGMLGSLFPGAGNNLMKMLGGLFPSQPGGQGSDGYYGGAVQG